MKAAQHARRSLDRRLGFAGAWAPEARVGLGAFDRRAAPGGPSALAFGVFTHLACCDVRLDQQAVTAEVDANDRADAKSRVSRLRFHPAVRQREAVHLPRAQTTDSAHLGPWMAANSFSTKGFSPSRSCSIAFPTLSCGSVPCYSTLQWLTIPAPISE